MVRTFRSYSHLMNIEMVKGPAVWGGGGKEGRRGERGRGGGGGGGGGMNRRFPGAQHAGRNFKFTFNKCFKFL